MKTIIAACIAILMAPGIILADAGEKSAEEKFAKFDKDKDGKISSAEYHEMVMEKFTKYDKDKDGNLTKEEYLVMYEDRIEKPKQGK